MVAVRTILGFSDLDFASNVTSVVRTKQVD